MNRMADDNTLSEDEDQESEEERELDLIELLERSQRRIPVKVDYHDSADHINFNRSVLFCG